MNAKISQSDKQFIVETSAKNRYIYLGKIREFVYIPQSESDIDASKIDYFHKLGAIEDLQPNFVAKYSPQLLKENLANLRQVLIEVTDGCNLRCKYCGYGELYSNYDKRLNKNMPFENVKGLLDYLKKFWESPYNTSFDNTIAIGFYGGEPLLNFELIQQVITYIDSMDLQGLSFIYTMTTNAVLLDRYMDYMVDKKFNLLISLDGNEYNDSYRITQSGNPSFSRVNNNVLELKRKYPDYFESNVDFNAVLHNRNSVEEITTYIWTTFGKLPKISDLNTNGIAPDKKEKFMAMFKNFNQSYEEAQNCDAFKNIERGKLPIEKSVNTFLDTSVSNTYQSYRDLFPSQDVSYIPTGTCVPFDRKIFLTVNGKILPTLNWQVQNY